MLGAADMPIGCALIFCRVCLSFFFVPKNVYGRDKPSHKLNTKGFLDG